VFGRFGWVRQPIRKALAWTGTLARLVVGAVWIVAGFVKLPDPAASVRAVRAYQLLPETTVTAIGYGLPILEICIGVLLVAGLGTRTVAAVSALLLLAYIAGIASAWARGLQIDCGCFGGGGYAANATSKYPWEIARDVGLLAASVFLVARPRTQVSMDGCLIPADQRP
jgi:uncharacterized membrane protein YphA (DoxX/SURF4 family)